MQPKNQSHNFPLQGRNHAIFSGSAHNAVVSTLQKMICENPPVFFFIFTSEQRHPRVIPPLVHLVRRAVFRGLGIEGEFFLKAQTYTSYSTNRVDEVYKGWDALHRCVSRYECVKTVIFTQKGMFSELFLRGKKI